MEIPRKSCPKCHVVYEGDGVADMFSCEQCGNGYLTVMKPRNTDTPSDKPLPRSGGGGTFTHTRDGW